MPNAQGLRLIQALDEFMNAYKGDTGNPGRGRLRGQIDPAAAKLVELAEGLHTQLTGSYGAGDGAERDTPGSRARDRASTGGVSASSPGNRARELMGAMGQPGLAAGGGTSEGGTP